MKTYIFNHSKLNVNWRSKIFILFFTIVSFVSCTDLSESTYTFINPGTYYNTEEELQSALNSVYADFRKFTAGYKILSASMIAEFARYLSLASHKFFPIRLCHSSYMK